MRYKYLVPSLVPLLIGISTPLSGQVKLPYFGNDSAGFVLDTISRPKVDPSHPWIWEVNPLELVRKLWYQIANCEQLQPKDGLSRIHFFIVNATDFGGIGIFPPYSYLGYTIPQDDGTFWIFLAITEATRPELVMHEFVHVLLTIDGYPIGHPPPFFSRCGMTITG